MINFSRDIKQDDITAMNFDLSNIACNEIKLRGGRQSAIIWRYCMLKQYLKRPIGAFGYNYVKFMAPIHRMLKWVHPYARSLTGPVYIVHLICVLISLFFLAALVLGDYYGS